MIVTQRDIDQILSRRRLRVLRLPVRTDGSGVRKRCPMRRGGVYRLRATVPYADHLAIAELEPTPARRVLALIELCEQHRRANPVTVIAEPEIVDGEWLIRFVKGDHSEMFDRPVFLSRDGGYTTSASRQAVRGDPEVMIPDGASERKRVMELATRQAPEQERIAQLALQAGALQASMKEMKSRNVQADSMVTRAERNLAAAMRNLAAAERLISSELDVSCDALGAAAGNAG